MKEKLIMIEKQTNINILDLNPNEKIILSLIETLGYNYYINICKYYKFKGELKDFLETHFYEYIKHDKTIKPN